MASPDNALVCALIATAFWSLLGYALSSWLVPRALAIGAAPVIGWSVHSAACFAGREMAIAFAPVSPERRSLINAEFLRVFDGQGTPNDVHDLATKYGCDVVVLVPQDKAWDQDPFATTPDYRLAEERDGRWKIYVKEKVTSGKP